MNIYVDIVHYANQHHILIASCAEHIIDIHYGVDDKLKLAYGY